MCLAFVNRCNILRQFSFSDENLSSSLEVQPFFVNMNSNTDSWMNNYYFLKLKNSLMFQRFGWCIILPNDTDICYASFDLPSHLWHALLYIMFHLTVSL